MENDILKERKIFFTEDFTKLKWHDCKVYGFAFDDTNYKFYLDIDFIVEWISPKNDEEGYKFRVAPATLVFSNTWDVTFDIDTNLSLEINNVLMSNPHDAKNKEVVVSKLEYDWHIELQQGDIFFKSIGFELYLRKPSILLDSQTLGLEERGGVSFSIPL
jgi:hypothetical protein